MLDRIWCAMILLSCVWGLLEGRLEEVSAAALEGAQSASELCLSLCAGICLWSGLLRLLEKAGAAGMLGRLLRPLLRRLYPRGSRDPDTLEALTENLTANLLGLGNAATPAGIRAAGRLGRMGREEGPGPELCRLAVLNSASLQLVPTTVCTLRAAAGSTAPFAILPAVWLSSGVSLAAGLGVLGLLRLGDRRRGGA